MMWAALSGLTPVNSATIFASAFGWAGCWLQSKSLADALYHAWWAGRSAIAVNLAEGADGGRIERAAALCVRLCSSRWWSRVVGSLGRWRP